jgi:hypothetical protein
VEICDPVVNFSVSFSLSVSMCTLVEACCWIQFCPSYCKTNSFVKILLQVEVGLGFIVRHVKITEA